MDFARTDEQELLVESIQEFCERNLDERKIVEMFEAHGMTMARRLGSPLVRLCRIAWLSLRTRTLRTTIRK